MSSSKRRLDDLEESLSPLEIFLRWLQEASHIPSLLDYTQSLRNAPESEFPLTRMTRQARRSVEKSMRGERSDAIQRAVHDAERHVVFLWKLHWRVYERIAQELCVAMPTIDLLWSELSRLVLHLQLSHDASRSAYPLDSHTSAAAWAALANQVRSWDSLGDPATFRQWGYIQLQPNDDEDVIEWLAGNSPTIKRELQRLVRSKDITAGKVVSLPALPIPFLREAPLLKGRWVDATVLELAEFGAVLEDRGWTPRPNDDSHPLAFQEFVQADAEGESSPIDDASWLDARQAATDRVRAYPGKRRAFQGRDYVNLAPYQTWRAGIVGARLEASLKDGFVVYSWNHFATNRGFNIASGGFCVGPIKPLGDFELWFVHDRETARILQTARRRLFANHRSVALDGENATAEEARIRWRDRAEDAIVMMEGLAAAIQGIQAAHFRSAEIVHTTSAKVLRRLRSRLRSIVRLFSGLWENSDPLRTYFDDRSCPQDRATAYSPQVRGYLKRIEQSIAQSGESLAHEFILEARRDALRDVNKWEAANRLADQVLDQHLSERKDGGR